MFAKEERIAKKQMTIKEDVEKMLHILQQKNITLEQMQDLEIVSNIVYNEIQFLNKWKKL